MDNFDRVDGDETGNEYLYTNLSFMKNLKLCNVFFKKYQICNSHNARCRPAWNDHFDLESVIP